jgi:hypothetical protein
MDTAPEDGEKSKGFFRHPLLAIAVWVLGGNNNKKSYVRTRPFDPNPDNSCSGRARNRVAPPFAAATARHFTPN